MPVLSQRALHTPPSPIRKLSGLAREAESKGKKVYYLNIGQPDIATPPEYFAGVAAFKQRVVAYERSEGNAELRAAWASYMNKTQDLELGAEQFLITTGASEALIFLFIACCDPGEEIIVFDPTYANYLGFAAATGIKLVPVTGSIASQFALPPPAKIADQISPRTRAILLCNPNNPTGTVYSPDEMRALLELCHKKNIFLIVDETYREFVYEGKAPVSIFNLAPRDPQIAVVDSLSKRFSLCGARVGCLITCNPDLLKVCQTIASTRLAVSSLEQAAGAHLLRHIAPDFVKAVQQEYRLRRDTLYAALQKIPGVRAHKPQGAFYTMVELPVEDAEEFTKFLLLDFSHEQATVFLAPGNGFYQHREFGRKEVRIAYVLKAADISAAVSVLQHGLEAYRAR